MSLQGKIDRVKNNLDAQAYPIQGVWFYLGIEVFDAI